MTIEACTPCPDAARIQAICLDLDGTLYLQRQLRLAMATRLLLRHLLKPAKGYEALAILRAYRQAQELIRDRTPQRGCGANSTLCQPPSVFSRSIDSYSGYAASAACQIAGIVAVRPPSFPILYCPFLIFSASSIPLITTAAVRKLFSPSIGRSRCFTRRWSCSMRLFSYLLLRTRTRLGNSPLSDRPLRDVKRHRHPA